AMRPCFEFRMATFHRPPFKCECKYIPFASPPQAFLGKNFKKYLGLSRRSMAEGSGIGFENP
ncbi:MAG: hypothetical protein KDD06_27195, partial [Phaeodactylibacter sp.]|nr:hypothetical protein [Phaeodactylibacter sp.]